MPKRKKSTGKKKDKFKRKHMTKKISAKRKVRVKKSRVTAKKNFIKKHRRTQPYAPEKLQRFRSIIMQKIESAREELQIYQTSLKREQDSGTDDTAYSFHMADVGTDAMEKEKTNMFLSRQVKFIQYLERALKRIDSQTYGICKVCGNYIEAGRLESVPHTEICISCKLKQSN